MDKIANAPADELGQCLVDEKPAKDLFTPANYHFSGLVPSLDLPVFGNDKLDSLYQKLINSEPYPLVRQTKPNVSFPLGSFPSFMKQAIQVVHEVVQAPLDMICQSFLAAATLTVQPYANIYIDGRSLPLSNFFIAVGESGERKSSVDRIATGPIKERQRKDVESFHHGKKGFEAEHVAWEKSYKAAFKENDPNVVEELLQRAGDEPKYVQPFYLVEEPSFEGLERAFSEGRYTLGLFSDDGGRFLGGVAMSKDNQTKTITGLSKLWDGDPIDRVRAGDGLSVLYGRRFSMHLMIQPVLTGQIFGNSMMTGQGFLSRCLCCFPNSNIGKRIYIDKDLSVDPNIISYNTVINAILDNILPMQARNEMGLMPANIPLSNAAKTIWINFANQIEVRQRENGDLHQIKGFASKAAEHALRVAGVLALFNDFSAREIDADAVNSGIEILHYYIGEALRLFHSSNDDQELLLAQKAFEWGIKQGGIVALADLYRLGPNAVRNKKTAARIMDILSDHFLAIQIPGGAVINGQQRRDVWILRR